MNTDELQNTLQQLHTEIEKLGAGDEETRNRLYAIIAELEKKLEHPEDVDQHLALVEQLKVAVETFEVDHPTTSGILNRLMLYLGNMGI